MLVRARRYMAGQKWGTQLYLSIRQDGSKCHSQGSSGAVQPDLAEGLTASRISHTNRRVGIRIKRTPTHRKESPACRIDAPSILRLSRPFSRATTDAKFIVRRKCPDEFPFPYHSLLLHGSGFPFPHSCSSTC